MHWLTFIHSFETFSLLFFLSSSFLCLSWLFVCLSLLIISCSSDLEFCLQNHISESIFWDYIRSFFLFSFFSFSILILFHFYYCSYSLLFEAKEKKREPSNTKKRIFSNHNPITTGFSSSNRKNFDKTSFSGGFWGTFLSSTLLFIHFIFLNEGHINNYLLFFFDKLPLLVGRFHKLHSFSARYFQTWGNYYYTIDLSLNKIKRYFTPYYLLHISLLFRLPLLFFAL